MATSADFHMATRTHFEAGVDAAGLLVDTISRCLSQPSPQRPARSASYKSSATGSEPHLSGFAAGSLESTPPEKPSR